MLDETTFKLDNKVLCINISLFPDGQDPVHRFPHLGVFDGTAERDKRVCKKYSLRMCKEKEIETF